MTLKERNLENLEISNLKSIFVQLQALVGNYSPMVNSCFKYRKFNPINMAINWLINRHDMKHLTNIKCRL